MAINAKDAAKIAANYYMDLSNERVDLSIEEIEFDENGFWLITLGLHDPYKMGSFGAKPVSYKIFRINAESGEVISMKIREIK